ncbi:MAG: DUF1194 domain-containing protein [Pseudomonadota bacterium]
MRLLLALFLWTGLAQAEGLTEVDVELVLAVDVSRSMEPFELEIQRRGYAAALRSPEVHAAIARGPLGYVALTYIEWAGTQRVIVPWTRVETPADANAFADQLTVAFQDGFRRTSISGALDFAVRSLETNAFLGLRQVIDVSGDGPNNLGPPVLAARARALAQGIVINGLPLMTRRDGPTALWGIDDLDVYYENCVIGGPGAFVIPVTDWDDFEGAVRRKLILELAGPPTGPGLGPRLWRAQAEGYNCLIGEEIWERNRGLFAYP